MHNNRRAKRRLTKSEQMARVRSKDTRPELVLRRVLWHGGLRYRLHANLPGSPDIVFNNVRVAVFVDGCFWHGCPKHYTAPIRNADFWRGKIETNVARDRAVDEQLGAAGWVVLRIWEHEVLSEIETAMERVERLVRERRRIGSISRKRTRS